MTALPHVTPAFSPQPEGVDWPTTTWPYATHSRQEELEAVVDEMFTLDELAVTNAVVVIQGGHILVERYGGVPPFAETQRYVARVMERYRARHGH